MTYNAVLVSGVQQRESVIHVCIQRKNRNHDIFYEWYKNRIFKISFIGVELTYNVVFVSGVQQKESVLVTHTPTHTHILFPHSIGFLNRLPWPLAELSETR